MVDVRLRQHILTVQLQATGTATLCPLYLFLSWTSARHMQVRQGWREKKPWKIADPAFDFQR